jgi:hypothetical protein
MAKVNFPNFDALMNTIYRKDDRRLGFSDSAQQIADIKINNRLDYDIRVSQLSAEICRLPDKILEYSVSNSVCKSIEINKFKLEKTDCIESVINRMNYHWEEIERMCTGDDELNYWNRFKSFANEMLVWCDNMIDLSDEEAELCRRENCEIEIVVRHVCDVVRKYFFVAKKFRKSILY